MLHLYLVSILLQSFLSNKNETKWPRLVWRSRNVGFWKQPHPHLLPDQVLSVPAYPSSHIYHVTLFWRKILEASTSTPSDECSTDNAAWTQVLLILLPLLASSAFHKAITAYVRRRQAIFRAISNSANYHRVDNLLPVYSGTRIPSVGE